MNKLRLSAAAAAVVVAIGSGGHARADAITTLFNTGVDANGATLPGLTTPDPHYTLVSAPAGASSSAITVTSTASDWIPNWLPDDTLSTWIGPNESSTVLGPPGLYDYQTTFSLTDLNPASAQITGQWSFDNNNLGILLNGALVSGSTACQTSFIGWCSFNIDSGFVTGTNTLDFRVFNTDVVSNPTGVRVEMTGTATPGSAPNVPEPASVALLGVGLIGLAAVRRRTPRAGRAQGFALLAG